MQQYLIVQIIYDSKLFIAIKKREFPVFPTNILIVYKSLDEVYWSPVNTGCNSTVKYYNIRWLANTTTIEST
jgi:hypothetical protein